MPVKHWRSVAVRGWEIYIAILKSFPIVEDTQQMVFRALLKTPDAALYPFHNILIYN